MAIHNSVFLPPGSVSVFFVFIGGNRVFFGRKCFPCYSNIDQMQAIITHLVLDLYLIKGYKVGTSAQVLFQNRQSSTWF